ncbi:hypothetical protein BDP81DRAFT_440373 [Colletotrichum phormii]|uniref:Uncharacterized protein n=1 Tax=Colletotrichum phormii TaxID=359342 RepID=A0AAI9ZEP0_9PEZI|nr:uncharacterized protein BDP81DRAFT_440373 [Colletotrichum phormii]KAK1622858.1 hypothetical protein BDP81DRAFT_440373 [Colletotrichum phormii]
MTPALLYSTQSDPTQQQSTPEEVDWSESELNEPRTSYRHHQRNTKPLNFEDTESQLGWDGTHPDPDSYSSYQEARFTTGQAVPYRRGYLEDFADPLQQRGHPKRNPPPQYFGPNDPQGFDQQPQIPTMNYHGVPPHPGAYPMYAPPMRPHPPAHYPGGRRNSMGGPRPMGLPPPPIDPYGPYYVPHPGPIHPHPYDATPRSHAFTGPRPQPAFPSRRKDYYTQYPAPQELFEGHHAERSVPKPKKQPKPKQEKTHKRITTDNELEEMKRGLEDLEVRQQQVHNELKAQQKREKKKASEAALQASVVRQVRKTVRKELENGVSAQLRDIDMRSELSRRMLRSDVGSRGFSTPVPSVYDERDTGAIIQAAIMETLKVVHGQSRSDLGGFQAPHRPTHRRAASEVPLSAGGYPPPRDCDTAATTSSNPFIPNQSPFGQPPYQGPDPQQRHAGKPEAYWTGRVRKSRTRRESYIEPQVQGDMNVPLRGGLSPGDSGYASPEPLRAERPCNRSSARKVSFREGNGIARPRCEDLGGGEEDGWPEDEFEAPEHPPRRARTYRTVVPGHPDYIIQVKPPPAPPPPEFGYT